MTNYRKTYYPNHWLTNSIDVIRFSHRINFDLNFSSKGNLRMKSLIASSLLNAAMDAQFATLGLSAKSWTVASIKLACKSAGLTSTQVSDAELTSSIATCFNYLTKKGCPPCDKEGNMLEGAALGLVARNTLYTLNGTDAKRQAEAKATAAAAAKAALEEAAKGKPATPKGDGKAALTSMAASPEVSVNLARAHKVMNTSKDIDTLKLAAFVIDFFETSAA